MDLPSLRCRNTQSPAYAANPTSNEAGIQDPLVLFNMRNPERLHEQVTKLKPALIQGTFDATRRSFNHFVTK